MRVHVTGGDYEYDGELRSVFRKSTGAVRYVVEDDNHRLFIHNAKQLDVDEGWWPESDFAQQADENERLVKGGPDQLPKASACVALTNSAILLRKRT